MNAADIVQLRLANQQISSQSFLRVGDLVKWMGAIQAQDYVMVKWALGIRMKEYSEIQVKQAIARGEILRTHVMRPTWHLVSADDIYWMLELTAPGIRSSLRSRHQQLGITTRLLNKSKKILESILSGGKTVTRPHLVEAFKMQKIYNDNNRIAHLLLMAELDGLICSGPEIGNKPTYALLEERVPRKTSQSREYSLTMLAKRYFASHAPATINDFIWWSGLPVSEARTAMASIRTTMIKETIDSVDYWIPDKNSRPPESAQRWHLLPSYDEYVISYKDRSHILEENNLKRVISKNGIFYPVIIQGGRVKGRWKRIAKKDKVFIEPDFFGHPEHGDLDALEKAVEEFGQFLGKEIALLSGR